MPQAAKIEANISGFLKEQTGGLFSAYKKFYFVLKDGKLQKFKDETQEKLKEELIIATKTVHAVVEASKLSGKKSTFALMFAGKPPKVYLADNDTECKKWMDAFRANLSVNAQDLNEASVVASIEGLVDAAIVSDSQCAIIGFNVAAEKIFGWKKDEVLGKNVTILMPEKYANVHDHYVQQYHITGNKRMIGFPRQLVAKAKDGNLLPVTVSLGEAPGQEEGKQCFVGIIRPIEMKPMERADSLDNLSNPNAQLLPYLQKSKDRLVNRCVELVATKGLAPLQEEFTKLQRGYLKLQKRLQDLEQEHSMLSKKSQQLIEAYRESRFAVLQLRPFYEKISITDLLMDNEAYPVFEAFCKSRHCVESVLFCKRALDFKKKYFAIVPDEKTTMEMRREANEILDDFIYDHSVYNINTSKQLRSHCIQALASPTSEMFHSLTQDQLAFLNTSIFHEFCYSQAGVAATINIVGQM